MLQSIARGLLATMLISLLAAAAGLGWLRLHDEKILAVQSGSMRPIFAAGDAVLVRPTTPAMLHIGQVISFRDPVQPSVIISHRIIGLDRGNFIVAGDAQPQQHQVVPPDLIVGRVTGVVPGAGRMLDAFHEPLGLALLVYAPATVLIIVELRRLQRRLNPPAYQLFPTQ